MNLNNLCKTLLTLNFAIFSQLGLARVGGEDTNRIEECKVLKDGYFSYVDTSTLVDCNKDFHLYEAKTFRAVEENQPVNLASFNIYKINNKITRYKRLDLIAQMFLEKKFDLIAVQEIFPISSKYLTYLKHWNAQSEKFKKDEKNHETMDVPSYIELLQELRRQDPTAGWSLILSNQALGAAKSALEQAGFYYKRAKLQPTESDYCKKYAVSKETKVKLGCMPGLNEREAKIISRPPFISSFKAKNFDFIALTLHARFRLPKTTKTEEAGFDITEIKDANNTTFDDDGFIQEVFQEYINERTVEIDPEKVHEIIEVIKSTRKDSPEKALKVAKTTSLMKDIRAKKPGIIKAAKLYLTSEKKLHPYKYIKKIYKEKKIKTKEISKNNFFQIIELIKAMDLTSPEKVIEALEKGTVFEALEISEKDFEEVAKLYFDRPDLGDEELYRTAEMKIIMEKIKEMESMGTEKDIIMMGDFNLEHHLSEDKFVQTLGGKETELEKMWNIITSPYPETQVFGFQESSLSQKDQLKSNYDHFLFNPYFTAECGRNEAKVDKVKALNFADPEFPLLAPYYDESNWDQLIEDYRTKVSSKKVFKENNSDKIDELIYLVGSDEVEESKLEAEVKKEVKKFKALVLDSQKSASKKFKTPYEVIADHLPIFTSCISDRDDD